MNTAARRLLWLFGVGNSALTFLGAIALSESNLSAVQSALIMNAGASTIAFLTLGIGELVTKTNTSPLTQENQG